MRKSCFFVISVVFCVFLTTIAVAKENSLKIGIVDTQKIIRETKAAKNARAVFQKELDARKAILEAKNKDIRSIEEKIKKTEQNADLIKLKEDLAKEVKEFNRLKSDIEEELKKKDLELTQKIVGEIRQVVQELSRAEGYTLIMEKTSVVTYSDTIDITDKVIKLYDDKK